MIDNDNRNSFLAILAPADGLVQLTRLELGIRIVIQTPVSNQRLKDYCDKHAVPLTVTGNGAKRRTRLVPLSSCVDIANGIFAENKMEEEAEARRKEEKRKDAERAEAARKKPVTAEEKYALKCCVETLSKTVTGLCEQSQLAAHNNAVFINAHKCSGEMIGDLQSAVASLRRDLDALRKSLGE